MKRTCTVCTSEELQVGVSFGMQPVSNRFPDAVADSVLEEPQFPLSLGHCGKCGTVQLVEGAPIEEVRPRYGWPSYSEPERHLDEVANELGRIVGITTASRFLGVSDIDKSVLKRIRALGFGSTDCIDAKDLKCPVHPFGLETVQAALTDGKTVANLRDSYGTSDVLVARYIIEHAMSARALILSLRELLAPGGYILLDLPDGERIFREANHAFVWEEHISYFTERSIKRLCSIVGAELVWLKRFPYPQEDCLNVLLRFSGNAFAEPQGPLDAPGDSAAALADFAASLDACRQKWCRKLASFRALGKKSAVFGAGHLAVKFINFYGLADFIDCVIDDNPRKTGMLMPGSHLPIVHSDEIASRGIGVCISTLAPQSEAKVLERLTGFLGEGGLFVSAFAST